MKDRLRYAPHALVLATSAVLMGCSAESGHVSMPTVQPVPPTPSLFDIYNGLASPPSQSTVDVTRVAAHTVSIAATDVARSPEQLERDLAQVPKNIIMCSVALNAISQVGMRAGSGYVGTFNSQTGEGWVLTSTHVILDGERLKLAQPQTGSSEEVDAIVTSTMSMQPDGIAVVHFKTDTSVNLPFAECRDSRVVTDYIPRPGDILYSLSFPDDSVDGLGKRVVWPQIHEIDYGPRVAKDGVWEHRLTGLSSSAGSGAVLVTPEGEVVGAIRTIDDTGIYGSFITQDIRSYFPR